MRSPAEATHVYIPIMITVAKTGELAVLLQAQQWLQQRVRGIMLIPLRAVLNVFEESINIHQHDALVITRTL